MRIKSFALLIVSLLLLVACSGESPPASSPSPAAATPASTPADTAATPAEVTVAAEGTEFDPAVTPDQLPDGAWMCVMEGKVHYAALDEGEGKCPVCSMNLTQKEAASPE